MDIYIKNGYLVYIQYNHNTNNILEVHLTIPNIMVINIYKYDSDKIPYKILQIQPHPQTLILDDFNAIGSRWIDRLGQ